MKRSLMSRIVALTMSLMILLTGSPVLAFAEDLGSTGAASGNENTTQTDGTTESNQDANADSKATTPALTSNSGGETEGASASMYTLTIYYYYEEEDGVLAKSPYVGEYEDGEAYDVSIEALSGYTAKVGDEEQTSVSGTITGNTIVKVVYYGKETSYTVTSNVEQSDGSFVTTSVTKTGKVGQLSEAMLDSNLLKSGYHATEPANVALSYDASTNIEITYYLDSIKTTFNSNGGSYVAPVYGKYGSTLNLSDYTPTRKGYSFEGWYANKDLTERVSGTVTVTSDATYYAKWKAGYSDYSVVYWVENANDDGYSYYTTVSKSGITGQAVSYDKNLSQIDSNVFAYKRVDGDTTIKDDNTSVVNVYYNRKTVTVKFWEQAKKNGSFALKYSYTGKKGAKFVDANGNNLWPSGDKAVWYTTKTYGSTAQSAMLYYPTNTSEVSFYNRYKSDGNVKYTTNYYVENGSNTGWDLHHTDVAYLPGTGWSLTDEDCYEIEGFTYYSRQDFGYGNVGSIYYLRNSYSLDFYYNSSQLDSRTVPYENSLAGYDFTPSAEEAGLPSYYSFKGWYTSKDCVEGSEFNLATSTMPAENVKLYAKFEADSASLTFDTDGGSTVETQEIVKGNSPERPENPVKDGYEFVGWYADEDFNTLFDFNAPLTEDTTVYAKFEKITETTYSIYYKDAEGNDLFEAKTGLAGKVGSEVKANALYSETLVPDKEYKTLVLAADKSENVITFIYNKAGELSYTVKYVDYETGEELIGSDSYTTTANRVILKAKDVTGYYAINGTARVDLVSGINEYSFKYKPMSYPISYDLDGGSLGDGQENPSSYTIKDNFTLNNPTKDGYIFTGWTGSNGNTPETVVTVENKTGALSYKAHWKAKEVITVTAKSASKTYDGSALSADGYNFSGNLNEGDTVQATVSGNITNAGTEASKVKTVKIVDAAGNDVTDKYSIKTVDGKLTIEKASLSIEVTGNTKTVTYDGESHKVSGFTNTELPTGLSVTNEAAEAQGTEVGSYKMNLAANDFKLEGDTASNYTASFTVAADGKLTIKKADVEAKLTASDSVSVYDGKSHTIEAAVSGNYASDYTIEYSVNGGEWTTKAPSMTNAGEAKSVEVRATSDKYVDIAAQTVTLQVTPKALTATAKSAEKVYDGKALTEDEVTISGLVEGESATGTASGSQTEVGESANTVAKVSFGENTKASNYEVTKTAGTLKVTPKAVTITVEGNNSKVTYNGEEQRVDGFKVEGAPEGVTVDLKTGSSAAAVGTNAGTYAMELTKEDLSVSGASNYDVTLKVVDGKLTIDKKDIEITVKGNSGTVTYNGEEQSVEGFTTSDLPAEVLVENAKAAVAGTNAGEYAMNLDKADFTITGTNAGNYNATFKVVEDGKLTVDAKRVVIVLDDKTKVAGTADPELTGSVTGLVKDDDLGNIVFTRETGEAVGTYAIGAAYTENSNYDVELSLGEFTITAAPVVPPVTPVNPTTPGITTFGVTVGGAVTLDAGAAPAAQTLAKDKAAKVAVNQWALINLLCAILTVFMVVILLLGDKKKKEYLDPEEIENEEDEDKKRFRKKFKVGIVAETLIAAVSVVAFILTENMHNTMALTDKWTLMMVVFAVGSFIAYVAIGKRDDNEDDETEAVVEG